jgi:hypothetical protein
MSSVAWDRLLETCLKREAQIALLVPGSPPLLQIGGAWRSVDVPPLSAENVSDLAAERLSPEPDGERDGFAYADFWYGDVAFFRVMAFGFPQTTLLVVSRTPGTRPPPADPPVGA